MWTARQIECWLLINSSSLRTWSQVQERTVIVSPTLKMYIFRNLVNFVCLYFPKHALLLLLVATYAVVF